MKIRCYLLSQWAVSCVLVQCHFTSTFKHCMQTRAHMLARRPIIVPAHIWGEDCVLPLNSQGHVWQLLEPDGSIDKWIALLIGGNSTYISLWLYFIWEHVTNKLDWLILLLPFWHSTYHDTLLKATNPWRKRFREQDVWLAYNKKSNIYRYEFNSVNSSITAHFSFFTGESCGMAWWAHGGLVRPVFTLRCWFYNPNTVSAQSHRPHQPCFQQQAPVWRK